MAEWSRATAILSLHKPCIAFSVLGPPATHLHGCTADMGMGKRRKCQPAMSHGKKLRARNAAASGCMCFASSARLAASPAKRCLFFPFKSAIPVSGWAIQVSWARWTVVYPVIRFDMPGQPREVVVGHSKGCHRAPTKAIITLSHVKLPISIS